MQTMKSFNYTNILLKFTMRKSINRSIKTAREALQKQAVDINGNNIAVSSEVSEFKGNLPALLCYAL